MQSLLITGVAGFIGSNAASHFARRGWRVVGIDNLGRKGADLNLGWLQTQAGIDFRRLDIRDAEGVDGLVSSVKPDALLHLAGQVAVTTSVAQPREDFETNAIGSLNLLESVRRHSPRTFVLYASTNKVYGDLSDVKIDEGKTRYSFRDLPHGVDESRPLRFHSPYGCSKGAADQYVLDYHKTYGLRTASLRQSCIYGPRQFGVEDQGWLAWFVIAAELQRPITIYGDGKQVRDVLHVDDLVAAYEAVLARPEAAAGQALNVGGGPDNALSLVDLVEQLRAGGRELTIKSGEWRVGDQRVFISDTRQAQRLLAWKPRISAEAGVKTLQAWVHENRHLFGGAVPSPP